MPSERLVTDLIRPLDQYFHVKEDDTVRDILRLMDKAMKEGRPLCLIVVEDRDPDKEMIKGFVTPREVVFGLATRFLKGAEKSGPILWEGQLEAECLDGLGRQVAEIMAPIKAYAREGEMLMEAIFLLHTCNEDLLPVASKEEVVGMIHLDDILREVIELTSTEQKMSATAAAPAEQ